MAETASWSVDNAVSALQSNALVDSTGNCASYTRQAIESGGGGVTLARTYSAKDYGPSLVAAGFSPMGQYTGGYKKGDVVIIQGFGGHPDGHAAMYDGSNWISDFKQRDIYPGPSYRKVKPSFAIYRRN